MANCHTEDLVEYMVSPMLVTPCYPSKYCEESPMCCPYLPRCPKGYVYCREKSPSKTHRPMPMECESEPVVYETRHNCHHCPSPTRYRTARSPPPHTPQKPNESHCPTCSQPICKPVKTKYVMPCYRYEDGRIVSAN